MKTLESSSQFRPEFQHLSLSSQQALAILAVDDIQLSQEGMELMRSMDDGTMTYDEAINSVLERANRYANQ